MKKRIRIRKAVRVAAFAASLSIALIGPAAAYESTEPGSQSKGCSVDARILHNEPQICSNEVFHDFTQDVEPASSTPAPSAPSTQWAVYTIAGALVVAAVTASAIRRHPQIVS